MANSSPPRPQTRRASPEASWRQRFPMSDPPEASEFLLNTRNSPEAHRRNFEDAQRKHRRVLEAALHVYELHQLKEARQRAEEEEKMRAVRVAEESKRIAEERQAKIKQLEDEQRLAAQKAAPIPKPVLPPPPSPTQQRATATTTAAAGTTATTATTGPTKQALANGFAQPLRPSAASSSPQANGGSAGSAPQNAPPLQPPAQTTPTQPPPQPPQPFSRPAFPPQAAAQPSGPPQPAASAVPAAPPAHAAPALQAAVNDRHVEVHGNLKKLRAFVAAQAQTNATLKARMGDMRRDIRKSFGQLTSGGLKENKIPVNRMVTTLLAGLKEVPSEPVDPNQFLLEPRTVGVEGCVHNEAHLPSFYLYLLNVVAKMAISQFITESSADTKTAEAIGQAVVKVFSEPEFEWRGKPLIDILIAKYRIVCPILFGHHGSDRTEAGRVRIGWKRENGRWMSEQEHLDRMTGLGAGFAALTLRDFSRVKRKNPWPPTAYWAALAKIVNTPPSETSDSQCCILKAMIANNEARFMGFYGHAAVAALRCALVDFPARTPRSSPASETLKVLAKSIALKTGLQLV